MRIHPRIGTAIFVLVTLSGFCRADAPRPAQPTTRPATDQPVYSTTQPSPDGIGKVYMGREIAQVMGHLGAGWLERPQREREEEPSKAIERMQLKPTDVVADIGAGTGYFSFRMAPKVPRGKVLAEDIQPEMLDLIQRAAKENGVKNVQTILGTEQDPKLPEAGVDVVLMVDSYHEFDHPREMMLAIVKALRPGGRVVDVEYRGEDPSVNIKPHHKMTQAQAIKEMAAVGLRHVKTCEDLPQQHLMVFEKPPVARSLPILPGRGGSCRQTTSLYNPKGKELGFFCATEGPAMQLRDFDSNSALRTKNTSPYYIGKKLSFFRATVDEPSSCATYTDFRERDSMIPLLYRENIHVFARKQLADSNLRSYPLS